MNDIPEAIRLGEEVVASNHEQLPYYVAKIARQYQLDRAEKHQIAKQTTGPQTSLSIYKEAFEKDRESYLKGQLSTNIFKDIESLKKDFEIYNSKSNKRAAQWRLPSIMAYDYKPTGILGELIGETEAKLFMKHQKEIDERDRCR